MTSRIAKFLFLGLLAITPLGCDSQPVVVTPDADDDTTIIERDVEVERNEPAMPAPQSDADVEVDVGGGKGIDVNVDRDGTDDTNP